ncbi:hypothetical protein HK100_006303 [Physocladia obscura]|uniref:Uncharacterized protein n=1 Tax=Physocladia obscura TaxID=109957 RepID=A0AAD5SRX9_9FUNG|nr:hypothetical protein HK100_006303 [Physocladia obscura]
MSEPKQAQPTLKAQAGVTSIKVALSQDMFNEISTLIVPIAESFAADTKIPDQHIKKHIPLLGEVSAADATNIAITKFDIKDVIMAIRDGFIEIAIRDVEFQVDMDMKAIGGNLGKVFVAADVDVEGKLRFGLKGRHCTTDVFDIKATLRNFDAKVGTGFAGEILEHVMDLLEKVLKSTIEKLLAAQISSALKTGLDSVLVRNWDIVGSVSSVNYKLQVDFVAAPVITEAGGVEYSIGVDSFFNRGGNPFLVDTIARDLETTKIEE